MDPLKILLKMVRGVEKGIITPESLSLGGVLETEIAAAFITLVIEQSGFLKKITTKKTGKIKSAFKMLDVAGEAMVRVPQGQEPTAGQLAEHQRIDVKFDNLAAQIFYSLTFDDIRDNQADPEFESKMEQMFALTYSNDLCRLGFRGIDDDYAASAWNKLNEGWNQVAKNDCPIGQLIDTNGVTAICDRFDDMIDAMPDKYLQQGITTFVLAPKDCRDWVKEMISDGHDVLAMAKVTGTLPAYMGYPVIEEVQQIPGEHTFSKLTNYWMTIFAEIERYREVSGRRRSVDYTLNQSNDYGFGNAAAVVHAFDQGGT